MALQQFAPRDLGARASHPPPGAPLQQQRLQEVWPARPPAAGALLLPRPPNLLLPAPSRAHAEGVLGAAQHP